MTTNVPGTQPSPHRDDTTVVEGGPGVTPTPVVTPTGVGGVAVYDQNVDHTVDPARRTSLAGDPLPVEARSTGSVMSWIIGAIVLILLAYFMLQVIF